MTQPTFTPEQIKAITQGLFDTLSADFNWSLGMTKRKAAVARWLQAQNYDALMQRAKRQADDALLSQNDTVVSGEVKRLSLNPDWLTWQDLELLAATQHVTVETLMADLYSGHPKLAEIHLSDVKGVVSPAFLKAFSAYLSNWAWGDSHLTLLPGKPNEHDLPSFDNNPNSNTLAGIQCPCCGNHEVFNIDTIGIPVDDVDPMLSQSGLMREVEDGSIEACEFTARYDDEGSDEVAGDSEFDPEGETECDACAYTAKTSAFYCTHPNNEK